MRNNAIVVAGLVIVLLVVTLTGLAFTMSGAGMMQGWTRMNGTGINGMMGGWLVIGALIIGACVLAVLWFGRRPGSAVLASSGRELRLDVLKMRYARGEITREQFEQMQSSINT
jgi:uncharacterized membrane protein